MPYYRCSACGVTHYSAAGHSALVTCPSCDAPLGPGEAVGTQTQIAISRTFDAQHDAPAQARRAVMALGLPGEVRDKVALLVSELVTNSVRHGVWEHDGAANDGQIHLLATHADDSVRLVIRDSGPGFVPAEVDGDGLGLVVVNALSDSWGVDIDEAGCTVWCTLSGQTEPRDDSGAGHLDGRVDGSSTAARRRDCREPAAD